jgi:hypothetical protein
MDKEKVELMSVTAVDIQQLEQFADRIFANVGIDVEFTKHFKDRVNSERNAKPIVPAELTRLFKQERKRYGKPIAQMGPDSEAVMRDLQTDINVPFALVLDKDNDELDLIAKTIMRKDNFSTPNRVFAVEDSPFRIGTRYEMPRSTVREEVDVSTERGRLEYYLKKPTIGKIIRLEKIGKFHDDKDELADYVPQRNGSYALHPDKWEATFYSLTNKDFKKINLYRPKFIDPPAGSIVADMAIANQFYRTDDEEEKIDLARRYEKSIVPFGSNISHMKMPEVILKATVVRESTGQMMSSEQMLAKLSKEMQGTHTGAPDPSSDWSKYVLSHKGFKLKDIQIDKIPTAVKSDGMSQANIEKYKKADTTKFPPVVIGDNGYLLDGNHRLQAYKFQGIKTIKAYIGESTVVTEGATKKHPKEPGAYLMTHNGLEYKISRHLDDNDIHRGEWDIFVKGISAFTGDKWEWVDTVSQRWNAIARVKGLSESTEKEKIAFDWLSESRAYRTPRQLNGLKQSQLGEQLFEQLLALQILANSDPDYARRIAGDIMKLQNWPGFRTSQPDLYNVIAMIMKPEKFKDRIAQNVQITIPELRLKRNLRNIAKKEFQNSDYSYMMLMLQRNMVDFLPAPLIQMRRQISNWERIVPRDKNVIRDRLMLQMRKSGLQNEFYEFLRRTKIFKKR